jgi:hypothetical protein
MARLLLLLFSAIIFSSFKANFLVGFKFGKHRYERGRPIEFQP